MADAQPQHQDPKEDARAFCTSVEAIHKSIRALNEQGGDHPTRATALLRQTQYWVYDPAQGAFGRSKFVAFADMHFRRYEASIHNELGGTAFSGSATRDIIQRVTGLDFTESPNLVRKLETWGEELLPGVGFGNANSAKWQFLSP
jgi:hypothetical protein